jgi:hypothetical protein
MIKRMMWLSILSLLLLQVTGTVANAEELLSRPWNSSLQGRYSNYDPDQTITFIRIANGFELASTALLTEVRWFGYFIDGQALTESPFRVRIFEDDAGLPGDLYYEESMQAIGTDTGLLTDDKPVVEFTAALTLSPLLQSGTTYWISIAHATIPELQFLWSRATTLDGTYAFRDSDDGPWEFGGAAYDQAFTLVGVLALPVKATTWSRVKALYAQ